jgi:hypothetical protein
MSVIPALIVPPVAIPLVGKGGEQDLPDGIVIGWGFGADNHTSCLSCRRLDISSISEKSSD